ncbi:histidinol-phosphate aminotransferase family protein [Knoellia locipacati]|uniref:aminotransferase class I/II-fold pyridoxal phosphate-dependent enzyme n=1 Tax=Knoellia locipacati TaxID=882824 RepID=UPI00384CD8CF
MASQLQVREANAEDLEWIYGLRHRVYSEELGQHPPHLGERLVDGLDGDNVYLVAASGPDRAGFISLTPSWLGRYGLDKYVTRDELPVLDDDDLFEARILTVESRWRRSSVAPLLMYAALRWISSRGGRTIVVMGRRELIGMYEAVGFRPVGRMIHSGAVTFEVMTACVTASTSLVLSAFSSVVARWRSDVDWQLDMSFAPRPDGCEHGGASFTAIGSDFRTLDRRSHVVSADVLDACFSPAPGVLAALADDPAWSARTSPPTDAGGLLAAIAESRQLPVDSLAVGAGSSDLIYRAFSLWLNPESRVLLVDPGYGEYAHVTERVIGCHVDRFRVRREDDWEIDLVRLATTVGSGCYDLVVVVNPNNPTGRHLAGESLRRVISNAPATTRWWVDEAYLGYVDLADSLASLASTDSRVVVCTSLSKMYALSGMRAAYLVAEASVARQLRRWTPPWPVSLPAQLAAVAALHDPEHYRDCWQRTHDLRRQLALDLVGLGQGVVVEESVSNFVNITLPAGGPSAARLVQECRRHGVYLRDLSPMSSEYLGRTVRIAVRDTAENDRIVQACSAALAELAELRSGSGSVVHRPVAAAASTP